MGGVQALKDANLKLSDINEVILVGGSTRIPAVQVVAANVCVASQLIAREPKEEGLLSCVVIYKPVDEFVVNSEFVDTLRHAVRTLGSSRNSVSRFRDFSFCVGHHNGMCMVRGHVSCQ